jgi:hypothetical protein
MAQRRGTVAHPLNHDSLLDSASDLLRKAAKDRIRLGNLRIVA